MWLERRKNNTAKDKERTILMKTKIYNLFVFFILLTISFVRLIKDTLFSVLRLKDIVSDSLFWLAIFYQPFLVMIVFALFSDKMGILLYDFLNGKEDGVSVIVLIFSIIFIILLINAVVELLFRIRYENQDYNAFFSIQKNSYNYMMTLVSLIAIYAAIDTSNATIINTTLLAYGILIFICIIITDLYDVLFLSQGVVKDIHIDFINKYERCKK